MSSMLPIALVLAVAFLFGWKVEPWLLRRSRERRRDR